MNTKQIVWRVFNSLVNEKPQQTEIDYSELVEVIHKSDVYDARTVKNYIQCMEDNNWLTVKNGDNPVESIRIQLFGNRRKIWLINREAKQD